MAKKPEKGGDELDMLKASLLKKDLDVITITDKMRRLEDRSQFIVGSMEKLSVGAREKIVALTDIVDFLTNEGNTKDNRIAELEAACQKAEQDLKDNTAKMNKQMADLTSAHEFQLNSMKLKLEAAQVRIREMADFSLKKKAIEDENAAQIVGPAKESKTGLIMAGFLRVQLDLSDCEALVALTVMTQELDLLITL